MPLLLMPSWALAIAPFLILPGPGPCPRPMCGGRGAVRRGAGGGVHRRAGEADRIGLRGPSTWGGAWARARQDQEGINSKGPRRDQ